MCLCQEARKARLSFIDFAEAVGAPVEALREWQDQTECYCQHMNADKMRRIAHLLILWANYLETQCP